MEIILMRHYRVDVAFEKQYNSQGFDEICALYNKSQIVEQTAPDLPTYRLYASNMLRAQLTAQSAFSRPFHVLDGVHEITMRSYKDTGRKMPKWWWEFMGRLQWRLGSKRPHEKYRETMARLESALVNLIEKDEDAIVVMHGMAMRYMVKVLRKYGFKGKTIIHAKNGACYRYVRDER